MSTAAAMVTIVALGSLILSQPAAARKQGAGTELFAAGQPGFRGGLHAAAVPLPRPRPAEAPPRPQGSAGEKLASPAPDRPAEPEPSACRLALTEQIAIAPSVPDIRGPGGCGGEDLVRLEAIVLPDERRVSVKPAAILRCGMASAIADWIRTDVAPLAAGFGSAISDLDNFDSFECRGRNRVAGAMLSEHGRANALDVRAIRLQNGQSVAFTDPNVPREVRERVLHSACTRFSTVLGPGSDGYHEDHVHLDLMQRRNGYRICQWDVWDPLPRIAPLLPAERPEQAPPREMATKTDAAGPGAEKSDADKSGGDGPTAAESNGTEKKPQPAPVKKRRQNRRS
jgi:hypothetical protein